MAGLPFFFDGGLAGTAPSKDQVHVFKPKHFFEIYAQILDGQSTRNVVELGIWNGGSALVLASLLDVKKLVAVDIAAPVTKFDEILACNAIGAQISPYYKTSQDDENKLSVICEYEFDGALDLVIDDASHLYGPSRASFEILFPRLRPGGWYIIEDWFWAHGKMGRILWPNEPSLAGLIFELQLARFGAHEMIADVIVKKQMVMIQKGTHGNVSHTRIQLDELYNVYHRSRPLVA